MSDISYVIAPNQANKNKEVSWQEIQAGNLPQTKSVQVESFMN